MNTLKIYITGVGGQGNVLASKLLGEAALQSRIPVVMSETHGMAQRGGVVESSVILGGSRSSIISDHCADVILSFEPMEAVRALNKAHSGTVIITNTAPVAPFIPAGQNLAYPDIEALQACLRKACTKVFAFDAKAEALAAGNALGLNMVMLGALYRAVKLPFSVETQLAVIAKSGKQAYAEANRNCFERGYAALAGQIA